MMMRLFLPEKSRAALPFLAILLHNLGFYINQLMFTTRGGRHEDLTLLGPVNIFGVILGALICTRLAPGSRAARLAVPLGLAVLMLAPRLAGWEPWHTDNHWRAVLTWGQGLMVAPCYYLFFTGARPEGQALGFGAALAAGPGVMALAAFPQTDSRVLYYLHTGLLALEALVLTSGWRHQPGPAAAVSPGPAGPHPDIKG